MMKCLKQRWMSLLSLVLTVVIVACSTLPAEAATKAAPVLDENFATASAAILADANTVQYAAVLPSLPATDDGLMYVYALQVYEYAIPAGALPVATVAASTNPVVTFPLNHHQANTRLYSKFVLAVKQGGVMKMIAHGQFVRNPELLATHTHARAAHPLKGLQGVDFLNLDLQTNNTIIASHLSRVTQVICTGGDPAMVNPYAKVADAKPVPISLYMLNANDAAAVNLLITRMEYYASTSQKCDDWIIGNEVNVRQWNYMSWQGWDQYMRQYEQVFRIMYIAIKSNNANANVYTCIDQNWDRNRPTSHAEYYQFMDGKDFLTKFAADMRLNGDIDWGVAHHPYTVPLTWARFWNMSGCPSGSYMRNMITSNKMVSFQNLSVVTNFLQTPEMLSPTGTVRHYMISELGIANAQGGQVQAAALCASYMAAARNPFVEQVIYSSASSAGVDTTFTPEALGMFNNMDGAQSLAFQQYAMSVIGISDWGQVLR